MKETLHSKLALGTAQIGMKYGIANASGEVKTKEAENILEYAWAHGINYIDTAIGYGSSETKLGEIGVSRFEVITKLPAAPSEISTTADWVSTQVTQSLTRLRKQSVYSVLVHRPQDLRSHLGPELVKGLSRLKQQGLVEKIGVSIYNPSDLDFLTHTYELDLVQAPLNLVDRRLVHSGWLTRLNQMGIEVHTRSAFLQGLLLTPPAKLPTQFTKWKELWHTWFRSLNDLGISPVSACLSYPSSYSEVTKVVVGVDSLRQLKEIAETACSPLPFNTLDFMSNEDASLVNPSLWHTT